MRISGCLHEYLRLDAIFRAEHDQLVDTDHDRGDDVHHSAVHAHLD